MKNKKQISMKNQRFIADISRRINCNLFLFSYMIDLCIVNNENNLFRLPTLLRPKIFADSLAGEKFIHHENLKKGSAVLSSDAIKIFDKRISETYLELKKDCDDVLKNIEENIKLYKNRFKKELKT